MKAAVGKSTTIEKRTGSEAGCGRRASWQTRSPKVIKTHQVEPDGAWGKFRFLPGEISCVRAREKSAEAVVVTTPAERREERRAEAQTQSSTESSGARRETSGTARSGHHGSFRGLAGKGRTGAAGASRSRRGRVEPEEPRGQKAMSEQLMEAALEPENWHAAWKAVVANGGAPGIDGMRCEELKEHLQRHGEAIAAKLLAGRYAPSPVKRVIIPKPGGGERLLGIPTVVDRFVQQLLLQVLTPLFEPRFSARSYGFRPGRSAHDAVRQAQAYVKEGKCYGSPAHQPPFSLPPPRWSIWTSKSSSTACTTTSSCTVCGRRLATCACARSSAATSKRG